MENGGKNQEESTLTIVDLPAEVLTHLVEFLRVSDRVVFRQLCKKFRAIIRKCGLLPKSAAVIELNKREVNEEMCLGFEHQFQGEVNEFKVRNCEVSWCCRTLGYPNFRRKRKRVLHFGFTINTVFSSHEMAEEFLVNKVLRKCLKNGNFGRVSFRGMMPLVEKYNLSFKTCKEMNFSFSDGEKVDACKKLCRRAKMVFVSSQPENMNDDVKGVQQRELWKKFRKAYKDGPLFNESFLKVSLDFNLNDKVYRLRVPQLRIGSLSVAEVCRIFKNLSEGRLDFIQDWTCLHPDSNYIESDLLFEHGLKPVPNSDIADLYFLTTKTGKKFRIKIRYGVTRISEESDEPQPEYANSSVYLTPLDDAWPF